MRKPCLGILGIAVAAWWSCGDAVVCAQQPIVFQLSDDAEFIDPGRAAVPVDEPPPFVELLENPLRDDLPLNGARPAEDEIGGQAENDLPEFIQPPIEQVVPLERLVEAGIEPLPPKQPMIGFELYRDATTWLMGNGDDFGFFSLEGISTVKVGQLDGWFSGYGVHFVGGPVQTDMPPRLFELFWGYRTIGDLGPSWSYDLTASAGIYTDFEGHAHQGWRVRGVGLAKYHQSPWADVVLGVAYLDRENLKLLPVAGVVITWGGHTRLELMFPEPRLTRAINPGTLAQQDIYVRGQLGGGSWAIERDTGSTDIATYEDLRVFVGFSSEDEDGKSTFCEVGYIFDRKLEYRSGLGDMPLQDTVMLRWGVRY